MSSPETILQVLRAEMRTAGVTYRTLADRIGMSESSVKRIFSSGDMSLTPQSDTLTLAQERALVSEPYLLLAAICCLGQWSLAQIVETYDLTEAACIKCLVKLDRLGLIELKPANRYRMKVSRAFRWRPDGPVQHYFREVVVGDYFGGRFDSPGETLLCVHARLSQPSAVELVQKIQQLAGELARLHELDQRLAAVDRDGFTLILGLRSWEFAAFTAMRRVASTA